jgi:predicted phosphoribosyltransferase
MFKDRKEEGQKLGTLRIISDSSEPFADRVEAGRLLAGQLQKLKSESAVVLGIPRGGVVIANEIAMGLNADLDVVLTHKLGAPANKELAVGSVSENGHLFINEMVAPYVGADKRYIEQERTYQLSQIAVKVRLYRSILSKLPLKGRVVIVTDDGVATGATMQAAVWSIRQEGAKKIILALPVGPRDSVTILSKDADEIVCLKVPPYFDALSRFYLQFPQVEDEELLQILRQVAQRRTKDESR